MTNTTNEQDDYDDINNDIAIIGMAGRFPMAQNIDEFWTNLVSSQDCITRFSVEELEKLGVNPALLANPNYVRAGGFIPDQDKFDAHFFEMNPREAANLDPQHRFALEVAWQTLEHAGYTAESVNGSVGVFAGVNMSSYLIFNLLKSDDDISGGDALDTQISVDKDMFASRISYKLNLNGPSIALGTACSTSLVCIHLACQSLLNGESKMALAGGSHIPTPNCTGHLYHEGGYSSPDGYCRSFDAKGKGTVGGAGTCFVLLKRMDDALADNDTIYAVIKGSAVNNDGSEKIGYTAPSIVGQTNIIAEAQAVAGVEPDSIRFIEAHGTATELGDPIEVAALTRAFRLQTDRKNFCGLGSVKSNIGHMGVAAGAASVVKAALSLKNKVIPESLNFQSPNPKLDIENSPFYVIDKLERIEDGEYPARAGISSLGIGGTNAHVILEEPPLVESSDSRDWQLLLLSAKTPGALDSMTQNLSAYMQRNSDEAIADAAYTLQVGRKPFAFRRAFVVPNGASARLAEHIAPSKGMTARAPDKQKKIVFMFPGGGTQYVDMARDLYEKEPAFAETMDACAALFKRKMQLDLIDLIYPDTEHAEANALTLQTPKNFFAALFAVEYSLAKLWMSWNVKPDALIGHSMGEYVAACIAGVFSLEDAVSMICCRGALFDKLEKGCMLSVTAPAAQVQQLLTDGVSLATINDPERCSVAGRPEQIAAFETVLQSQEIEYKKLLIDAAGHSPMIDAILPEFGRFLSTIKFNKPSLPFISNLSGNWVDANEICTPEYWKKHLRQTVRFADGVATLLQEPNSIFLEVGPGNILCSFVRAQLDAGAPSVLLNSLRHVREEKDDLCHLLETTGKLWGAGVNIDWKAFYEREQRKRIALPGYPFERKRYWIEPGKNKSAAGAKLDVADWFWQPSWRLDELAGDYAAADLQGVCLIFADDRQYGAEMAQQLLQKGARVISVTRGDQFIEFDQGHFQIDADVKDHYHQLIARLIALDAAPRTILHCWGLSAAATSAQQRTNLQHSFVYLAQALAAHQLSDTLDMVGVTSQREAVLSNDAVDCMQALITGPANVIPYEYPHIRFVTLDVNAAATEAATTPAEFSRFALQELASLAAPDVTASAVALRNGLRFVKDYIPLATSGATPVQPAQATIKQHGVYLVTGGLGGVGMVHAQALAAHQTRLALLQRSPFPAESAWDALLNDPGADALHREQIKGLKSLQEAGAQVMVLQADVNNRQQLSSAIADVKAAFGAIDGLVHCAGYGEFVPIKDTSQEIIDAVLAPKVDGTDNLLAALSGENLSLVLLCSSMSAQTTGYGLVGYVSACAYLDAIAQAHRSDAATRYLSINWDIWNTPQQALKTDRHADPRTAILPREGIDVIHRALSCRQPQAIISTIDFQHLLRRNKKMSAVLLAQNEEGVELAEADTGKQSLYDRPSLSTEYVAPSTDAEKLLASIWQETLGISTVGVNDNFFELGGESLLGVRIVVKAKKMGLIIDPKQMFKTPTIAQIVQNLSSDTPVTVDQAQVQGEGACTPVQQQFLQTGWHNRNQWNVGALFNLPRSIGAAELKAIGARLIEQHDVLRSHFVQDDDGGWQQVFGTTEIDKHIAHVDLSALTAATFAEQLQQHCQRLQAGFDVETGPLFMLAYVKAPADAAQDKLLILAHHLIMDALSLGVVIEDLATLLALTDKADYAIALPAKTNSYKAFAAALQQEANADVCRADVAYWQDVASKLAPHIKPVEAKSTSNLERDAATLTTALSADTTQRLLQDATRHSKLKINELLLAAFATTLAGLQQQPALLIDVVHHGRPALPSLDLSRTVGWFGVGCPLPLTVSDAPLAMQLQSIQAQIAAVPQQGLSLAWIAQWHNDAAVRASLSALPGASASINYLGNVDQLTGSGPLAVAADDIGALRDPANRRAYRHELVVYIKDGQIVLNWTFSTAQHPAADMQNLLDGMALQLQQLCSTDWDAVRASCALRDISAQTLAAHGIASEQIQDYYPLTAFQSEMYRLYCDQSDRDLPPTNVTQALSVLEGALDKRLLQATWQALVARHDVLRTRFLRDAQGKPLQVVCKQADFALIELDYSGMDDAAQQQALQQLMVTDRQTRYTLSAAPALRLYWVTLDPQSGKFAILLSNHQIILDGWTSSLLSKDLLACLMAVATGTAPPPLRNSHAFADYIGWLEKQDRVASHAYWRDTLADYPLAEPLQPLLSDVPLLEAGEDGYAAHEMTVEQSMLDMIQECARVSQTTGNAVFQAAWALSLAQLSDNRDIVYGVTVSGRSSDFDGMTEVVGQCTNSLPVRIAVNDSMTVAQFLQSVHQANSNAQAHNTLSLMEIKTLLGHPADAPLYSSNFIFENIPRASAEPGEVPIKTLAAGWIDGWQFPLRVFVVPEQTTWVRFAYDKGRLSADSVQQLAERYRTNLAAIAAAVDAPVATLWKISS